MGSVAQETGLFVRYHRYTTKPPFELHESGLKQYSQRHPTAMLLSMW